MACAFRKVMFRLFMSTLWETFSEHKTLVKSTCDISENKNCSDTDEMEEIQKQ